ncbi:MAG: cation transporter [Prolixibacteraceae bacterium]|jgi:copper ion binding protein|nr:cation transporter [Prolixibacteraceae bacterium]
MKKIIFIFAIILGLFACNSKKTSTTNGTLSTVSDTVKTVLHVEGMTCDHCEMTVQSSVGELSGLIKIEANYEDSTAYIQYDASQLTKKELAAAIEKKGYKVVGEK